MNDEVKEILEDVKRHLDYVEATKQCSIRYNEMKVMYDYITNLQEALLDIKEYIENRFDEDKGIWIIDCYELLEIVNKAIGEENE